MAVVVGDIELVGKNTVAFSGYSHNTVRGAAGGTLLLAELALIEGRFSES
jgi:aspartate-semialdehyde dehydrogenase